MTTENGVEGVYPFVLYHGGYYQAFWKLENKSFDLISELNTLILINDTLTDEREYLSAIYLFIYCMLFFSFTFDLISPASFW